MLYNCVYRLNRDLILFRGMVCYEKVLGLSFQVYWTDAKKDLIGSMNMDGSDLRTFKVEGHAFSIAVSSVSGCGYGIHSHTKRS